MKTLYALVAAAAVTAAMPANAATNFTVDAAASKAVATSSCFGNCKVTANLATFSPFQLNVGQSQDFTFATYQFSGIGVGTASIDAVLAFTDPFSAAASSTGTALYARAGGVISAGVLTWSNAVQTLEAANGTKFSVRFNGLAGIGSGNRASSSVTVSLLAAAVPEPATWAMMLVGFGMVAGAARYRRRAVAVAFG